MTNINIPLFGYFSFLRERSFLKKGENTLPCRQDSGTFGGMGEHFDWTEWLDALLWTPAPWTRAGIHQLLTGGGDRLYEIARADRFLRRLEQEKLLTRQGRAAAATFTVTASGRERVATLNPDTEWNRPWDGQWRVVTFDLPETRRRDRKKLWQALRVNRFGLLQRSVWVRPHDVEPLLRKIIEVEGVPECFCGFLARQLFLCTDSEVVQTAWDFREVAKRQRAYLEHPTATFKNIAAARDLATLFAVARAERIAYTHAFVFDPLLPRVLWSAGYLGPRVAQQHTAFRAQLRARAAELTTA